MRRIVKVICLFIFSAFLLLPLRANAAEPVWTQNLDLTDSVSSAIAKVEDGVVVMQYEGAASANNLLIKYDFDGNKVWEINNEYGYNIESVSDGFIVWSETKITKFDKDKNILWSNDVALEPTDANDIVWFSTDAGLGGKLVELDDYYIVYQVHYTNKLRNDIFSVDKNGNIIQRISINDFLEKNNLSSSDFWLWSVSYLSDNKFLLMYDVNLGGTFNIAEVTNDFTITKNSQYDDFVDYHFAYSGVGVNISNIISTDEGYIILGDKVVYLLNDGNTKRYDKLVVDSIKEGEYIYTYEFRGINENSNSSMLYNAYLVQYNMDMEEEHVIKLPLLCDALHATSGLAQLKNRFILKDENNVVVLNTPLLYLKFFEEQRLGTYSNNYEVENGGYSLARYRFSQEEVTEDDNEENNNAISGIINNIIKNPQTNSIIIISFFVILIVIISIISYLLYKKKNKKL